MFCSKKENLWYQQEIELATKDNAEYISYLESKKEEKLVAIQVLAEGNKRDQEGFLEKKKMYKEAYEKKIAGTLFFVLFILSFSNQHTLSYPPIPFFQQELQDTIAELEVKLNGKEDEFLQLSDTMVHA